MRTFKHFLLYSVLGFGFLLGSFSSAQVIIPDQNLSNDSWSSQDSSSYFHGNVISSVNGAKLVFSDSAFSEGVGEPMFFWYGQLLNTAITFFPVVLVVSMFWLIYGYLKHLGNKNSLDSKTSLNNK